MTRGAMDAEAVAWARVLYSAAHHQLAFRVEETLAEAGAGERAFALVSPRGVVAEFSVLGTAEPGDGYAEAERLQRRIGERTGRPLRVALASRRSSAPGVQASGADGAVVLVASEDWLADVAPGPPMPGDPARLEVALDAEPPSAAAVVRLDERVWGTVLLGEREVDVALAVGMDGIEVTGSYERASEASEPMRARFEARIATVEGGRWGLEVAPVGLVAGRVVQWVTDGARVGLRVGAVAGGQADDTVEVSADDILEVAIVREGAAEEVDHGA